VRDGTIRIHPPFTPGANVDQDVAELQRICAGASGRNR